ncbi:ADC synthase [Podospora didyma]|uniref:aminodeoxychorismate synthase n=1 Tax=Podospora didyma TaxID=330526 RepID=A0AAE0KLJ0_9PEZI|nr:ADC synthase [Podospora didyma]
MEAQQQLRWRRPKILFLDAYDSFSNNITALLTTLLDVDVFVLPIDEVLPRLDGDDTSNDSEAFRRELSHYAAVVCGPGPGSPGNDADVGLMSRVWGLADGDLLPVLGICLGFQSLVASCGGQVRRLQRGLHGMVREIVHRQQPWRLKDSSEEKTKTTQDGEDIFCGVGAFKATLYHSLCGDIGQDTVPDTKWAEARWQPSLACPDLLPLAWVEEDRGGGGKPERILMAVKHRTRPFWGLQYHPESVCTESEGNQVILNWFRKALQWNEEHGRGATVDGSVEGGANHSARNATKPSLLSTSWLPPPRSENWWESLEVDPVLHSVTVPLPRGMQVPEVVELVDPEGSERIILDSANATASASARPDVRGRYSIIATGLEEALRIEYHTGDNYATAKLKSLGGLPADLVQRVPLGSHGSIWGLIAVFHEARHLEATELAEVPFIGGFMGYITYEQGLSDIGIQANPLRQHRRPDVCLVWVTKSLVIDHLAGLIHIQKLNAHGTDIDSWVDKTESRLLSSQPSQGRLRDCILPRKDAQQSATYRPLKTRRPSRSTTFQTPMTKEYERKVELCQELIAAGESYELCLTDQTRITRPRSDSDGERLAASGDTGIQQRKRRRSSLLALPQGSWQLFKTLRTRQPAPFASYIRLGAATLVSASPERFLQYDREGRCSMRPMKGTVRKSEAAATLCQAERILHVPKEEAENLMIVDLVRHDLHSICGAGNVSVPHLLKVEEYQSVFQMITVVEGQLPAAGKEAKARYTGLDVLAASLPPGSMTGAPKKRSCELLQQIEQHQERSLYSGVVGYMCASGRGDWSVTIRSLFRWDDEDHFVVPAEGGEPERQEVWHIGAGGAVTILSTPEGEREEMFTKLAGPLCVFAEAG